MNDYRKDVTLRAGVGIAAIVLVALVGAVLDGNDPKAQITDDL